ncbi:MAG: GldG family protein [Chloroflexi bacterium]|nr:GldG family protein [Chloroflexota bacterium]
MSREAVIIRRNQLGQWAGFIGGGAALLGIIGLLWQGGLTPIIIGLLVAGAAGLGLWALLSPQEFVGFVTGRQARYGTVAVFGTLLLIGIVALTYIVLQRAVLTLDMTEGQRFTLSSESLGILRQVTQPIRITGFYSPRALQLREVDDQFFRLYEVATDGRITREYIDPDVNAAQRNAFGVTEDGSVFISYLNPDGTPNLNTLMRVPIERGPEPSNQERDLTGAIARLLAAGTLTVYFDTSNGALSPFDTSQQGLSAINDGMRANGVITSVLNVADLAQSGSSIPANAAAIILARPTQDYTEAEVQLLGSYVKGGGALLILADPLFNEDAFLRQDGALNRFLWDTFGIRARDAVAVENDPGASAQSPLDIISAAVFTDTDIGARLNSDETPTLFTVARALEVNDSPPPDVANGRVILTSQNSYGETNFRALAETNTYQFDAGQDIPGPLTTVAWANIQQTNGRVVLIGDSDFVTNGMVGTGGNGILFTDSIAWLTRFGERINFKPQAFTTGLPMVFVSTQTLDLIAFITVILMPGLVLLTGLAVWLRRQRLQA